MPEVKIIPLDETSFTDERGWVINPLQAASVSKDRLSNLHVVSIEPGAIRGNHYHTSSDEWMVVFGGAALIAFAHPDSEEANSIEITGETPNMFYIPANVSHAIRNISRHVIYLLAFRDSETADDTVRCEPLLYYPSLYEIYTGYKAIHFFRYRTRQSGFNTGYIDT